MSHLTIKSKDTFQVYPNVKIPERPSKAKKTKLSSSRVHHKIARDTIPPKGYESVVLNNRVTLFFEKESSWITIQKRLTKLLSWSGTKFMKGMKLVGALVALPIRSLSYLLSLVKTSKKHKAKRKNS